MSAAGAPAAGTVAQSACFWYCQNAKYESMTEISSDLSTEPTIENVSPAFFASAVAIAPSSPRRFSVSRWIAFSAARHAGSLPTFARNLL